MNVGESKIAMDRKHVGAQSELVACAWLLANGYEVFRNVSSHGLMDIIAIKGGQQLKIDVKTASSIGRRSYTSPEQDAAGIIALVVHNNGKCELWRPVDVPEKICVTCGTSFKMRSHNHNRCCSNECRRLYQKRQSDPPSQELSP